MLGACKSHLTSAKQPGKNCRSGKGNLRANEHVIAGDKGNTWKDTWKKGRRQCQREIDERNPLAGKNQGNKWNQERAGVGRSIPVSAGESDETKRKREMLSGDPRLKLRGKDGEHWTPLVYPRACEGRSGANSRAPGVSRQSPGRPHALAILMPPPLPDPNKSHK